MFLQSVQGFDSVGRGGSKLKKNGVIRSIEPLGQSMASPGFVARRGKDGNYVMGHSR